MNSPFILTDESRSVFTVSWPTLEDIRQIETKIKLLEILFDTLQVDNAGLVIKYNQDELDIMWISINTYYMTPEIDQYMHDHYTIIGVSFRQVAHAEKFKDYLEKKLVWNILND